VESGILAQLNKASSAEDFFALLGVDYDPKHVNVVRLHILRRMGQYLVSEDFAGMAQAYADFIASSPLDQRVFKVLKDAVAPPPAPKNFVPLATLK
jgi:nitrogenase-stabilizing/protective protein